MVAIFRTGRMRVGAANGESIGAGIRDTGETYFSLPDGLTLGELAMDDSGNVYRLLRARGTQTYRHGAVCQVDGHDTEPWYVTLDESVSKSNIFAGICMGTPPQNHYFWGQVSGFHGSVRKTSGVNVTEGYFAYCDDGRDGGVVESGTTYNVKTFGIIQRSRGGTTTTCEVQIRGIL